MNRSNNEGEPGAELSAKTQRDEEQTGLKERVDSRLPEELLTKRNLAAKNAENGARETVRRFQTRAFTLGSSADEKAWSEHNGLTPALSFSHNLGRIFPPTLYTEHPEFFPGVKGERYRPAEGAQNWNPDLGRGDVAAWAASAARKHFEAHPESECFSVGVNDGLIFGDSEETRAFVESRKRKAERKDPTECDPVSFHRRNTEDEPSSSHQPQSSTPSTPRAQSDGTEDAEVVQAANRGRSAVGTALRAVRSGGTSRRVTERSDISHARNAESRESGKLTERESAAILDPEAMAATRRKEAQGGQSLGSASGSQLSALSSQPSVNYFRQRPDFSDLVFTFTNRVAAEVAKTHPDKYVGALAYYWCENAPGFPVQPNVIPFLTADRAQGYDEAFHAEERALQRRWAREGERPLNTPITRKLNATAQSGEERTELAERDFTAENARNAESGGRRMRTAEGAQGALNTQHSALSRAGLPRRIGLYDYLYGSGFLIPRIHTRLIADNLREAHRLGFTDYFAEVNPNWGLDGPMPWLVAQLLQNPEQSREVLLEEYYARYFLEAAVPMRRFFEQCEQQWMNQPGPAYWLKHYRNESQARLFPSSVCYRLRGWLDEARRQARNEVTRERVRLVSEAFGVTERFVAFCEARDAVNREKLNGGQATEDEPPMRTWNGHKRAQKAQNEQQILTTDNTDEHGLIETEVGAALRAVRSGGGSRRVTERSGISHARSADSKESGVLTKHDSAGKSEPEAMAAKRRKEAQETFQRARAEFVAYTERLQKESPLTVGKFNWEDYLRHEPPAIARCAIRKPEVENTKAESGGQKREAGNPAEPDRAQLSSFRSHVSSANLLRNGDLHGPVVPAKRIGSLDYGVAMPEGWLSKVEPAQGQSAELKDGVLRLTAHKDAYVYQWLPVDEPAVHRATVRVRGQVGPSTVVSLTVGWLDAQQKLLGVKIHRLPEGAWPEWVTLEVELPLPAGAKWIGVGLRVQHQMGSDWVEAEAFRLERGCGER